VACLFSVGYTLSQMGIKSCFSEVENIHFAHGKASDIHHGRFNFLSGSYFSIL